jgi:hypothetical protein
MRLKLIGLILLTAAASASAVTPINAVRTATAPRIDGRLDDACWQRQASPARFVINNTSTPASWDSKVWVAFDDQGLYIAVRCDEPDPSSIETRVLPRDHSDIFRTDCVEVMIDPGQSGNNYYHFGVNASGSVADEARTQGGYIGDFGWDARVTAASHIGDDYWSCELAIPYHSLSITPQVGATWGFNVCREKKQPAENSSLAEQGAFNIATRFAELRGIDADLSRYCYVIDEPTPRMVARGGGVELQLDVPVTNATGSDGDVLVDAWIVSPSGSVVTATQRVQLAADAKQTITLGPVQLTDGGAHVGYVRVADPITKKPLAVREMTTPIEYVPVALRWVSPWYRDAIFATQDIDRAVAELTVRLDAATLAASHATARIIDVASGEAIAEMALSSLASTNRLAFDAASLPQGTMRLDVTIIGGDGETITQTSRPLRKLPHHEGEVWLGRDMQWHIDGEPFFINGAWNYAEDFLPEYNVFTGDREGALWLDTGIMNELWYKAPSLKSDQLSDADAQMVRDYIMNIRDNPRLFGYYTSDEPEVGNISARALSQVYDIIAELDPYHPVVISNDSMHGLHAYAAAGDINGLHPYPVILRDHDVNDVGSVGTFVAGSVEAFTHEEHKQTIAYLHQGFNYGDHGAVNNRIPNYLEYRNQNLLAIISGANGFIQFNRMVAHYPELYIGMGHLTRELDYLGPFVLAPTSDIAPAADHGAAKMLLKDRNGELVLFVCNADMQPRDIRITIPGIDGKPLNVISEARRVTPQGDAFTDHFGPYEAHIYTTGDAPAHLLDVAQIIAMIDEANAARRKPGNLAFQMFEGDGVVITASSHQGAKYRRPDTGLWHVVDGVVDELDRYHNLTWQDDTAREGPDWLAIQLTQTHRIGRVVVVPFDKTLRDYSVQAFVNGEWTTVASVTGHDGSQLEHTFDAVTTDQIRIFVTATNGPNAMVTEVEIYEQ